MTKQQKKYDGSAYVGVVGPDNEPGACRDSIEALYRRPRDEGPFFVRATKGYEARQTHLNNMMNSHHDWLFLMDHDMSFPADALEKLRATGLPYISGFYMRRQLNPVAPVWYRPFNGKWPLEPWVGIPENGTLHKIGASGWGCLLVHREVIEAVRGLLFGEWEVLEDDMDIWPYDLPEIMQAIRGLRALVDEAPTRSTLLPALAAHTETLERQIRPLRVDRDVIGSDIRFPFFALQAGYQLYGHPDVLCGHTVDYLLGLRDYTMFPPEMLEKARKETKTYINASRRQIKDQQAALYE